MTTLHLNGVALQQHDEPYTFDYQPYKHQLTLQRLVQEESDFVAVNDSPTGGGKTSSWLAPALSEQLDTIAIYPTNALVVDQTEQIEEALDSVDHDVSVLTVTAERLSNKRNEFSANSNGDGFERWYQFEKRRHEQLIVLTNPDVFVMFCRDLYRNPSRAYKQFPFVVVDEFHRADRKEQNTLRYLLDELYERDNHAVEKIAFLSATPDEEQERKFRRAIAPPYHRITKQGTDEQRPFTEGTNTGWRAVMPPADLDVRAAPTFGTADTLRQEGAETVEFCREGRTAIILDGIHEVKRISEWLDEELDRKVKRIDGFHSERKGEKLDEFDVLVSNSAVEVGVDFEIDRLLFAGHNHASFLQRLGRLRTKERRCRARCYVPTHVARDLEEYNGQSLTRSHLDEILAEIYPTPRKPTSFDWRYSAPEALEHLDNRLRHTQSGEKKRTIVESAQKRIRRHFLAGTDASLADDDIKRTKEAIDWRVLQDLQWYRGDSLQALVYDRLEDTVRSYDLFYLLRYGDVEFLPKDQFEGMVPEEHSSTVSRLSRYVDGFCTYDGTIETTEEGWGRSVAFRGSELLGWLQSDLSATNRKPTVLPGVKLSADRSSESQSRVRSLDILNERLQNRRERTPGEEGGILCYAINGPSRMVAEQYNLGEFFFLYPAAVSGENTYSIALGTDALYLHCHVMDEADGKTGGEDDFIGL
jgi:CRISPR-associated endonuclease/helicase Cas3